MLPSIARGTLIWCETSLTVTCAERRYVVGARSGAAHRQITAPLVSGAPTENTAQPQHQEPGDHREQDDVEVLKIVHRPARPAVHAKVPGTGSPVISGLDGLSPR